MGGSAFSPLLPSSSFPRLRPAVYAAVKTRLLPILQNLYSFVAVPIEAPEKLDHGDLDFVVACPISLGGGPEDQQHTPAPVNVENAVVQAALGARFSNPMDGNRTSNFAVPVVPGEWASFGHAEDEAEARRVAEGEIFYQVDVHVCTDRAEWERIMFFHAYGDLGMILGLIARNAGLALGTKGLKLPNPPYAPVDLSDNFDTILDFMGLSMADWKAGFSTKQEVFEWAGTSEFFNPRRFRFEGEGIGKVKPDRKMYAEFVQWAMLRAAAAPAKPSKGQREEERLQYRERALVYFNQKEAFDIQSRERAARIRLKEGFSGSKVRDWTDLGEYWKGVKLIMDGVRERLGGDDGVLRCIDVEGEDGLKKVVLEVKEELKVEVRRGDTQQGEMGTVGPTDATTT